MPRIICGRCERLRQRFIVRHYVATALEKSFGTKPIFRTDVILTLDLSPVYVPAVKASPLSLIVNELVGDAVRRGLGESEGEIHVVVKRLNRHFLIKVEDASQPGEPDDTSAEVDRMLLEASARQLEARMERRNQGARTIMEVTLLIEHEKIYPIESHDRRG